MNKEEVLARSRQSGKSEGVEHAAELRGHKLAVNLGLGAVGLSLVVYGILFGQVMMVLAVTMVIEAYYTGLMISAYRLSRSTRHLLYAILFAVIFIFITFMFVRGAMGLFWLPGMYTGMWAR